MATRRETAIVRLLVQALAHIQSELDASGLDEVRQHPMLREKQEFVNRVERRIKRWETNQ